MDGDYRISDLDVYFFDRYGTMFQNRFGNGTVGLGSSFQVIAYLGGTMDYQQQGAQNVWKNTATGGFVATVHTGKIHSISFQDRMIRIRSKSKMANIANLKWQFPVYSFGFNYTIYGSHAFRTGNLGTHVFGTQAFYDYQDGNSKWKGNAYVLATSYGPNGYLHVNGYPAIPNRGTGTMPLSGDDTYFYYPGTNSGGTNFYSEREAIGFDGTYFTTLHGTINTHDDARAYGYSSLDESEAAKVGTTYPINKTRMRAKDDLTGSYLHFICPIAIDGNPKQQFEHLIYGAMVTPLFTSSDVDSSALAQTGSNTAYFYMKKRVWYDDKKVIDSLKDLFNVTQSLFYVNTSDKFEYRTYGPINFNESISELGTSDLIHSSFNNYEEDFYNRFVVKYKYNAETNNYLGLFEQKSPYWGYEIDRPLIIETTFIQNPNEASLIADRLCQRYKNTLPHISFQTNLNKLGLDIGTLLKITDPNSGLATKVVQVVGYRKAWSDKVIEFESLDGEAIYLRKGYAFWEGDNSLTAVVSGTSTSGWGTNGTVNNINTTIYGTQFNWW